jgi:hypothetical protein
MARTRSSRRSCFRDFARSSASCCAVESHPGCPEQGKNATQRGFRLSLTARWMWQPVIRQLRQEPFDSLVSVVTLTDFHQVRKMEFYPGFDLARRNVITTRFQTLRQLLGTPEHPHRLAADIRPGKKRCALTGPIAAAKRPGLLFSCLFTPLPSQPFQCRWASVWSVIIGVTAEARPLASL